MQISRNIVNWSESNNYVLVGIRAIVCVQNISHHFFQTLHRMFQSVFRDTTLYQKQLSLFCLLRLINASSERIGYISNFYSMIELLHELKNIFFNIEAFMNLIMSQQGKRKTKSLLDFYTQ